MSFLFVSAWKFAIFMKLHKIIYSFLKQKLNNILYLSTWDFMSFFWNVGFKIFEFLLFNLKLLLSWCKSLLVQCYEILEVSVKFTSFFIICEGILLSVVCRKMIILFLSKSWLNAKMYILYCLLFRFNLGKM